MNKVVILGGGRIPFQPSGTVYKSLSNFDLAKEAILGCIRQTAIEPTHIDHVYMGNVIQEVSTSNVAREASLQAGIPNHVPATTVAQACISSSQCVSLGARDIQTGHGKLILAGGVETFSDVPIRYPKKMRQWLIDFPKISKKGTLPTLKYLSKLNPSYFKPVPPALANFTTGELMGQTSEKIASRFGVSRMDQDEFTIRSHDLAYDAHSKGLYDSEIYVYKGSRQENNIRQNMQLSKIKTLKPSFIKNGTHTAANSSGLTDGASCCLIGSQDMANELSMTPLAYLEDSVCIGTDPFQEMLLGPAYSIPKLLQRNNLTLNDIGVFEIHEAFAGQLLANLNALDNQTFCEKQLNMDKLGLIPMDKLNLWGGSLAIGHPLAASNIRNIMTAINRMKKENKEFALVSACADSGLSSALLLKNAN